MPMKALEVINLKKYFHQVKAVDDISFSVNQGEIFGFLGPNGAGKTTTIRCVMDFLRPTGGEIKIFGDGAQKHGVKVKKNIGYLSGNVRLYHRWNGQMHIDFINQLNGEKSIARELCERFDFNPEVKVKNLSSGNRQKLGLILALMCQPKLYIFDEPTNALDPILQNEVYLILKELANKGATIFMSSHNLSEVEKICSRVGIIKNGRMVTTENINSLKEKLMHQVIVAFNKPVPKKELAINGIEVVRELPQGYALKIKGDLNLLIKKLNQFDIKDLEVSHASLEEIFLEYYEK